MKQAIAQLLKAFDAGRSLTFQCETKAQQRLIDRLLAAANPRDALLNCLRVMEAAPSEWKLPNADSDIDALAAVLTSGPELPALIVRHPARLAMAVRDDLNAPWSPKRLTTALHTRLDRLLNERGADEWDLAEIGREIAAFRNDHYVRLAVDEFGQVPLESVGRELANVADACVAAAIDVVVAKHAARYGAPCAGNPSAGVPATMAAFAMGKYGAQELNFCSDIDLIFIYSGDEGSAGQRSLHEFFAGVCRDVVHVLSDATEEGFAFRVDLRLRPEGSRGAICNSLNSAERYYETWGGPYDRLSWLKARVAAGDATLGQEMLDIMRPFVFSRAAGVTVIDDIKLLSRKIRAELREQTHLDDGWNVKLGTGGIRDIEFFAQALQLVHAGQRPSLRERATLRALDKLVFAGLVTEEEHRVLADAYDFYRRIEHRLQLYGGRQTHHLPGSGPLFEHVVRHMGYAREQFVEQLSAYRAAVERIYGTLGASAEPERALSRLLDTSLDEQHAVQLCQRAGFDDARWAKEQLHMLAAKPWGPFSDSQLNELSLPLLQEIVSSPDPDAALRHVVAFSLQIGPLTGPWAMLAENPMALRLLCSLFGTSDLLAKLFVDQPELVDQLLLSGRAERIRDKIDLKKTINSRLTESDAEDLEQLLAALEQLRDEELLRIGLHDIAGDLPMASVWEQLSDLAEFILRRLCDALIADASRRYGHPQHEDETPACMAVVGLGKLGAREMSYGSDLDLIFIYSGEGYTNGATSIGNGEFFARVSQRLIRALTTPFMRGVLYHVDTRLRPSGSQGTLVSSQTAFEQYHASAQIWERQVLLKARVVAGDEQFGARIQSWIDNYVYEKELDPTELRAEVVRLRERIEREIAQENRDVFNVKFGRGGLLDVEFVAQYLQLCFGTDYPSLRTRTTIEALSSAREAGILSEHDAQRLLTGFKFLRRLEGRMRIVRGRSAEQMSADPKALDVVARRLGYREQGGVGAGTQLMAAYKSTTEQVRDAFNRIMGV